VFFRIPHQTGQPSGIGLDLDPLWGVVALLSAVLNNSAGQQPIPVLDKKSITLM
jgi:hypothetical protein